MNSFQKKRRNNNQQPVGVSYSFLYFVQSFFHDGLVIAVATIVLGFFVILIIS